MKQIYTFTPNPPILLNISKTLHAWRKHTFFPGHTSSQLDNPVRRCATVCHFSWWCGHESSVAPTPLGFSCMLQQWSPSVFIMHTRCCTKTLQLPKVSVLFIYFFAGRRGKKSMFPCRNVFIFWKCMTSSERHSSSYSHGVTELTYSNEKPHKIRKKSTISCLMVVFGGWSAHKCTYRKEAVDYERIRNSEVSFWPTNRGNDIPTTASD